MGFRFYIGSLLLVQMLMGHVLNISMSVKGSIIKAGRPRKAHEEWHTLVNRDVWLCNYIRIKLYCVV